MDPDFVRELAVLGFFLLLYILVSAALLKNHKADISAVHIKGGVAAAEASVVPRLNRRRKAMQREQAQQAPTPASEDANDDNA